MENLNLQNVIDYLNGFDREALHGRVIGLIGVLGCGKTQLVKSFVRSLVEEAVDQVNSPTYNICNIYQVAELEVHHYDLYRIEMENDLYETGIFDSIETESALVFIEWVDLFPILMARCDEIIFIEPGSVSPSSAGYKLVENS